MRFFFFFFFFFFSFFLFFLLLSSSSSFFFFFFLLSSSFFFFLLLSSSLFFFLLLLTYPPISFCMVGSSRCAARERIAVFARTSPGRERNGCHAARVCPAARLWQCRYYPSGPGNGVQLHISLFLFYFILFQEHYVLFHVDSVSNWTADAGPLISQNTMIRTSMMHLYISHT